MSGPRMKVPVSAAHAKFAAELRAQMESSGVTRLALAARLDVSATMVGYWRVGRYLPSMTILDALMDVFPDSRLNATVRSARTGRCPCGTTFDREQHSRQAYCSLACQRRAHLKGGRKADPRQDVIDAMCAGCEPTDKVCRDDGCALRPFSPFLFVALHRRTA